MYHLYYIIQNIKANESKAYVVKALELGYKDKYFCCRYWYCLTELSERNTHGVPFDKIEKR
jgi:hypothetical protein